MDRNLFLQAIGKFTLGFMLVTGLLFASAGSFAYWNAWLFLAVLFIPMFLAGVFMMRNSPDLLRSRLNAKEEEREQRQVVISCGILFIVVFALAGLTFRFQWSTVPRCLVYVASVVFLLAYILYAEVLRENRYLSRTVEVQEGQKVIDTGLYGIVRHPMYAVTLLLFLSMPLILGSLPAFLLMLLYPFLLVKRIRNEEQVLLKTLPGYDAYLQKVPYRLIPIIW